MKGTRLRPWREHLAKPFTDPSLPSTASSCTGTGGTHRCRQQHYDYLVMVYVALQDGCLRLQVIAHCPSFTGSPLIPSQNLKSQCLIIAQKVFPQMMLMASGLKSSKSTTSIKQHRSLYGEMQDEQGNTHLTRGKKTSRHSIGGLITRCSLRRGTKLQTEIIFSQYSAGRCWFLLPVSSQHVPCAQPSKGPSGR